MKNFMAKEMQILKRDLKGNLKPNKRIVMAQKITINWGKDEYTKQMITIRELLQKYLQTAAEIQVKYYNKLHMAKTYNIRDMVLLLTKNIKLACLSKKL